MPGKVVEVIEATIPLHSTEFTNLTQKKRVAAYARVSTDKEEQENSFETQIKYYTEKIQSNPQWDFVEVYSDEGITGTSMKKRDGFNRMIDDALEGKIDLILTKSVSRFARNTVDSLTTVRKLKDKGVEVYFEKENIYTLDSKGELLITIMSSLAQEEARSISENTAWGLRKRFAEGKYSLAYSNFLGYDKGPDGELVINEDEAVIIRRIYDEYLSGLSPYTIAKRLTEDGIKTPGHKAIWQPSTVKNILTNEKYYGGALLQKSVKVFMTKVRPNTGQLPRYLVEHDHFPIIPPVKFRMVQEEMQRRKEAGCVAQSVSIFSGRIVCGDCGGYYGRKKWHSGTKYETWHWHCNNKFQKRKYCTTPTLKETCLKEAFVEVFNRLVKRKSKLEAHYNLCLDAITDTSEYERRLEELNSRNAELRSKMEELLYKSSRTADDKGIADEYENCQRKLTANTQLKLDQEMKIATCRLKRSQISDFLAELKQHEYPLTEFDPLVWHATIHHARVDNDCTITFVFRDGTERKANIKNGVRHYNRKPKADEVVDGNNVTNNALGPDL